jgi:phospholipid transport system substrate-binding protein
MMLRRSLVHSVIRRVIRRVIGGRGLPRSLAVALALVSAVAAADPKDASHPAPAQGPAARTGPGTQAVKAANDTIASLLKQKVAAGSKEEKDLAAKVTTSVRGFLDIDQLGKRAMVDNWQKLSKPQQDQFLGLLRELIEDNYVRGLRANLEYTVDYNGESTDKDGNIVVATQINTKRHGRPYKIEVDYVLKKDGDKWKAWDVKTDGVGLVENYRTQFNKIIETDGFNGLISKMKKKQSEGAAATPPT